MAWSLGHTVICVLALLLGLLIGWLTWGRKVRAESAGGWTALEQPVAHPTAAPASTPTVTAPVEEPAAVPTPDEAPVAARTPDAPAEVESADGDGEVVSSAPAGPSVAAPEAAAEIGDEKAGDQVVGAGAPAAASDDVVRASAAGSDEVVGAGASTAASEAVAGAATPDAGAGTPDSGPADDLRRISGVGPKTVLALNAAGIRTFKQLAESDETTLRAALRSGGQRVSPSVGTWPEQARTLLERDAPLTVAGDTVSP